MLWCTNTDLRDTVYYYESAPDGMYFYVDMAELILTASRAPTMRLPLVDLDWSQRVGDMTAKAVKAEPFIYTHISSQLVNRLCTTLQHDNAGALLEHTLMIFAKERILYPQVV
jgi:hypothetical protein